MSQTLSVCDKAGDRSGRLEGRIERHQRAVENFRGNPARVLEGNQINYSPQLCFLSRSLSDLDPSGFELVGHRSECVLVGDLPADVSEVILAGRMDEEA